jgi:hypothetical protein
MVSLVEEASDLEDDQSGMETDKEEEVIPKITPKKSKPKKNTASFIPYDAMKPCWAECGKLA